MARKPKQTVSDDILVVRHTFFVGNTAYRAGMTVRAGHPITKGREQLFAPLVIDYDHAVEQATAAPGERRVRISPNRPPVESKPIGSISPAPPTKENG